MLNRTWMGFLVLVAAMPVVAAAQNTAANDQMQVREAAALTWTDLVVPGFAPGTRMAAVYGDPSKEGPYVMRLQFPDGYEFPLHWHPAVEELTVLSGSFHLAMESDNGQGPVRTYAPGDFIHIPARMAHAGGAKGVTIIQLHGTGPFAINLGTAK
jgi:quercetin dioxygenase-like cupin family protein